MGTEKQDRHLINGRRGGDRLPLVCVHGDEANRQLPDLLHPNRPFAAFKHQGDGGTPVRLRRVERIAERFLQELNEGGWKAPFILCGYSFGGLIAFEMAQQLRRADTASVPLLILIDTYAPELHAQAMGADRNLLVKLRDRMYDAAVKPYLRRGARIPPKLHHHHIIATYDEAIRAYAPKPYTGRMLLLKSSEGWGPEDMGWHATVEGGLLAELIPADHFNIVKPPQLGMVAQVMEQHIQAIEALKHA
jgi:acetoacetyl-CoA synthetase